MTAIEARERVYLGPGELRDVTWQADIDYDQFQIRECTGATVFADVHSSIPGELMPAAIARVMEVYGTSWIATWKGASTLSLDEYRQYVLGQSELIYDFSAIFAELVKLEDGWHMEGDRLLIGPEQSQVSESTIYKLFCENELPVPVEAQAAVELSLQPVRRWPAVAIGLSCSAIAGLLGYVIGAMA